MAPFPHGWQRLLVAEIENRRTWTIDGGGISQSTCVNSRGRLGGDMAGSPGLAAFAAVVVLALASPSRAAEPVVGPAVDGVLAAFKTHPIVGLSDQHGLANEGEFYNRLVKDPRFATEVGNVVVEFAGAAHQDTLDRYLAGEEVPYAELRKVWSDTVGFVPTVNTVMYQLFFAQVRAVNRQLPPGRRIHVWAGEPAIDWSTVRTEVDYGPSSAQRNEHPAELIEKEILGRGKKALVIYGGFHFNKPGMPPGIPDLKVLKDLVEAHHPGAFFVVSPYIGFAQPACSAAFEAQMKWPAGTLVGPVRGTALEAELLRPGCSWGANLRFVHPADAPPITPEEQARMTRRTQEVRSGVVGDALLYLGPQASLMNSPGDATLVMDEAYFREISRRNQIMTGSPANLADWIDIGSHPPQPYLVR
jgi:hypothetical protein